MTTQQEATEQPFSDFVGQLITVQHEMARDTASRLIDSLTDQLADAHARADAVQDGIIALTNGDYAPSTAAIQRALFPSAELIAQHRRDAAEVSS